MVILPDYQGIGLGKTFLTLASQIFSSGRYKITIATSAKNLIYSLNRPNSDWKMFAYGKSKNNVSMSKKEYKRRINVNMASFALLKNGTQTNTDRS